MQVRIGCGSSCGEAFSNVFRPVPRFIRAFDRARALTTETCATAASCHAIIGAFAGRAFRKLGKLGFDASRPKSSWKARTDPDDPDAAVAEWRVFDVTNDPVAIETLVWAAVTSEMPIQPSADALIYFVSAPPRTVLHIYDDRGLDIMGLHAADLAAIRRRHDDWILDYDRERIARAFDGQRDQRLKP